MSVRSLCFLAAGLLYLAGLVGVATLGALMKVNVALMLLAFGTGFLVAGIVIGTPARAPTRS